MPLSKLFSAFYPKNEEAASEDIIEIQNEQSGDTKQPATDTERDVSAGSSEAPEERPDENAQEGVRNVEAITLVWTKKSLIIVFASIWLMYFMNAFQASITSNLTPFVLSDFASHSLVPVIGIASNVMAGALRLAVSKMLDLWGRPQGVVVMTTIATLSLVLMAVCTNVQTYAAAQVFYSIGFDGYIYTCDVITSDSTNLKNRALAFAFTSSPYIITAFAGPTASEGFYENISWRWAFGTFCILTPIVAIPLFSTLTWNQRKAKKRGLITPRYSGRTLSQSIWFYIIEFDALGVFLFAAGFSLFLLPFSLAESAADQWRSAHIIVMLVLGVVLIAAFALCERFVSPKPFLPFGLLLSPTVVGSCLLCASYQVSYYCWASYFTSFLQVVNGLSIEDAGYVSSSFDVVSGVFVFFSGWLIRYTDRFKWILLIAVPLEILGQGLMIYFRQPHQNVGYIVMCQVFIAVSGGTIILTQQISIQSVAKHGEVAATLALLGLFGYIGGAVGNTISGAVWTNTLPGALQKYLPASALPDWEDIYNDLDTQLSYPMGSPTREAIIKSYGLAQRNMCIAATAVMGLCFVWVMMIKDVRLSKVNQTKGLVF
ncbi:MFS general substrate transporter [Rhizodiscina lignyota]|uniref:MFS general substrate transporter n=1 Tax=Rhizodiscina lignyota TaxID=1504668 RepID=A0A9P4IJN2_9PEZI|nr:MFS general substrate transporter [Rhizodiscina lignyota]